MNVTDNRQMTETAPEKWHSYWQRKIFLPKIFKKIIT